MALGKTQFLGAAGEFYVAYGLASRSLNVGIAVGNAPSVDLHVSSADGTRSLALQVKAGSNAFKKKYGDEGYEWDVNGIPPVSRTLLMSANMAQEVFYGEARIYPGVQA